MVVISFNGGSELRLFLFMTTDRAPDVARGPRALKDGYSLQTKDCTTAENDCSLSAKVSQRFGQTLSLTIWKSLQSTPMEPQRGNIGRPPQAGAGHTPALTGQPEQSPPSLPALATCPLLPFLP